MSLNEISIIKSLCNVIAHKLIMQQVNYINKDCYSFLNMKLDMWCCLNVDHLYRDVWNFQFMWIQWKSVLPQDIHIFNCITYKMSLGSAIPYLKRREGLLYDAAREGSQQLAPLRQQTVDWPSVGSTFGDSCELERTASLMVHPDQIK